MFKPWCDVVRIADRETDVVGPKAQNHCSSREEIASQATREFLVICIHGEDSVRLFLTETLNQTTHTEKTLRRNQGLVPQFPWFTSSTADMNDPSGGSVCSQHASLPVAQSSFDEQYTTGDPHERDLVARAIVSTS